MSTTTPNTPAADALPAFILGQALPRFIWTVLVPAPGNDSYSFAALPLEFQAVDQDELDLYQGHRKPKEGESLPTDAQILQRVVVGWPSLKDKSGQDVPFSQPALARLMLSPMVRSAAVSTYLAAMSGMAARKNG